MKLRYHPLVQRDVTEILTYYQDISPALADGFWDEFEATIARVRKAPKACHFDASGLRRANLKRFPYHVLFRIREDSIKVMVVRHHRRRATFGTRRT